MAELDKALVSIGIKGQDAVLSALDRVQKKKKSVTSDTDKISLRTQSKATISQKQEQAQSNESKDINSSSKGFKNLNKDLTEGDKKLKQFTKDIKDGSKEEKKSAKSGKDLLDKHLEGAKQGASSVTQGVSSMSPAALAHSIARLPGAMHLGTVGKIAGAGLGAATVSATGALDIAKNAVKSSYELSQRNASTSYYGGDKINRGNMSNNEKAQLVASVSGSFGKLQKPMQDVLNKLSPKKDTGALAQVSSGNWRSTGSDKGFFLQKLSDSFGDLPPSIAQKFQSRLLEKYGDTEIQDATAVQKQTQGRTAGIEISEENKNLNINDALNVKTKQKYKDEKTGQMYDVQTSGYEALIKLNDQYNKLVVDMVKTGQSFSGVALDIAKAGSAVTGALNILANKASSFFYRSGTKPGSQ